MRDARRPRSLCLASMSYRDEKQDPGTSSYNPIIGCPIGLMIRSPRSGRNGVLKSSATDRTGDGLEAIYEQLPLGFYSFRHPAS